jgi:hypothetical protein
MIGHIKAYTLNANTFHMPMQFRMSEQERN